MSRDLGAIILYENVPRGSGKATQSLRRAVSINVPRSTDGRLSIFQPYLLSHTTKYPGMIMKQKSITFVCLRL